MPKSEAFTSRVPQQGRKALSILKRSPLKSPPLKLKNHDVVQEIWAGEAEAVVAVGLGEIYYQGSGDKNI